MVPGPSSNLLEWPGIWVTILLVRDHARMMPSVCQSLVVYMPEVTCCASSACTYIRFISSISPRPMKLTE